MFQEDDRAAMTDEETERALAAMHKLDEPARRALNRFVRIAYCGRTGMAFDPAAAGRAWSLLDRAELELVIDYMRTYHE
jgi:hypothetical protein